MPQGCDLWPKIKNRERLSVQDGLRLFKKANLLELGQAANQLNEEKNGKVIGYVIDRNLNYTNVCVLRCTFCAFRRDKKASDSYVLSFEEIDQKIEDLIKQGGTQILMQGGHHPELKLDFYTDLLSHIKDKFPQVTIHAFSPPEIHHLSKLLKLNYKEILQALKKSGLDSIPGGGAEILQDKIRQNISAGKCSSAEWLKVFQCAHELGIQGSATMMFGHGESLEDRLNHLKQLRNLQDKTGGFFAFIPWTYVPGNSPMGGEQVGAQDYLRTLAISRLFLDNFKNIQISWLTQGIEVAQVATQFGGNDFGSTLLEENVLRSTQNAQSTNLEEMQRVITIAGKKPLQRDTFYRYLH